MPKKEITKKSKSKISELNLEQMIMNRIKSGQINMKPRWYFITGSLLLFAGLVGSAIGAIFLLNLSLFLARQHGPMGEVKLQLMLSSFPWQIPVLAIVSVIAGIYFLKKYDFSYKKNFILVVVSFIITIFLAAIIIDLSGINDNWFRQGPMRRLYQQNRRGNFTFQNQRYINNKQGFSNLEN